ncbi:hypothetical protein Fmac_015903 [Flemingia macrophylla]|uniref:Uncharacterized protein n=1 Tax=Flemingia macrophylla TaxID=520843 RepID=A0ABD1MFW3_9FABA
MTLHATSSLVRTLCSLMRCFQDGFRWRVLMHDGKVVAYAFRQLKFMRGTILPMILRTSSGLEHVEKAVNIKQDQQLSYCSLRTFSPTIEVIVQLQPRCSEKVDKDSGIVSFITRLLVVMMLCVVMMKYDLCCMKASISTLTCSTVFTTNMTSTTKHTHKHLEESMTKLKDAFMSGLRPGETLSFMYKTTKIKYKTHSHMVLTLVLGICCKTSTNREAINQPMTKEKHLNLGRPANKTEKRHKETLHPKIESNEEILARRRQSSGNDLRPLRHEDKATMAASIA